MTQNESASLQRNENETPNEAPFRENESGWLSVKEAARRLYLSERAVQIKAKAGQIPSRKRAGRWEVCLPSVPVQAKETKADSFRRNENEGSDEAPFRENETPNESELVEQLRGEVAFLRTQLEQRGEEIRRRDQADAETRRLMMADRAEISELRQKIALLAAPSPETESVPQVVPELAETNETDNQSLRPSDAEKSKQQPKQGFWARLFGKSK